MQAAVTSFATRPAAPVHFGDRCRRALPGTVPPAGPRPQGARRLRTAAAKNGHRSNGGRSGATLDASPDQMHATKMLNLTLEYFEEVMSKGKTEACHRILDPQFAHKDMVRNEGRYGIDEYQRYIHDLKDHYPGIWVHPTQFGVVDSRTLFVAFEGRATDRTPMFRGVDLFFFNDDATKIREIEVYRSNWLGAEGHEDRKRQAQQQQRGGGQPRMTT